MNFPTESTLREKGAETLPDGLLYFSIQAFAKLTKRTEHTIYKLVRTGNRFRPLKSKRIGRLFFIPASEYLEYPFTPKGNSHVRPYHFNLDGTKREVTDEAV